MRPVARTEATTDIFVASMLQVLGSSDKVDREPKMSIHAVNHRVQLAESAARGRVAMLGVALAMLAPRGAAAQSPAAGPDEAACQGKQVGDGCTLINGTAGACGQGTCARLDYSQGSPPKSTEEPCTVCVAGAAPNAGPPLGETAETTETSPASGSEPPSTGDAKASETDEPPQSSSRCSVMDRSAPSDLGWLALLLVPLAASRRTRRSR
jgi:hypothetical protein